MSGSADVKAAVTGRDGAQGRQEGSGSDRRAGRGSRKREGGEVEKRELFH
jgi:hypothetical protein